MELGKILEPVVTGIFAILAIWLREKWNLKNKPTLSDTAERIKKVETILSEIQYELEADRVQEWIVTNGEKTMTGHSIQKLSIYAEFNKPGVSSIAQTFQFIPASNMSRNIISLAESNGYHISNEHEISDDLAALHATYGIKTIVFFKIFDSSNKWVGILSIAFFEPRTFTNGELAFLKLKASQLGVL